MIHNVSKSNIFNATVDKYHVMCLTGLIIATFRRKHVNIASKPTLIRSCVILKSSMIHLYPFLLSILNMLVYFKWHRKYSVEQIASHSIVDSEESCLYPCPFLKITYSSYRSGIAWCVVVPFPIGGTWIQKFINLWNYCSNAHQNNIVPLGFFD